MADAQVVLTAVMRFAAESLDFTHPNNELDPIDPPMDSFDDTQLQSIADKFHQSLMDDGIRTFVASSKMRACKTWERLARKAYQNQTSA